MSTQALFQNIAVFLKESPEWVESWFNTPVKAKYQLNPLILPEILTIILNNLSLDEYKTVNKFWYKVIQALEVTRAKILQKFSLTELQDFYYENQVWRKQFGNELHRRHTKLIDIYWDIVSEYKQAWKELCDEYNRAGISPQYRLLSSKHDKTGKKKRDAFTDQLAMERCIMRYNFASIAEILLFSKNHDMLEDGFDPYEVDISDEFTNDYWSEENLDIEPDELSEFDYWGEEDPDY